VDPEGIFQPSGNPKAKNKAARHFIHRRDDHEPWAHGVSFHRGVYGRGYILRAKEAQDRGGYLVQAQDSMIHNMLGGLALLTQAQWLALVSFR
jgi:hypothetical protein